MPAKPRTVDGRTAALFVLAIALMVALVVAWRIDAEATTTPPEHEFLLTVIDETGLPIAGAVVTYNDTEATTDGQGSITVRLRSPELAIVEADGMLPDAVVIGTIGEPNATLTMLADAGPGGERTVLHFGGDYMMGRRYVEPAGDNDTPLVSDATEARAVVSDIAPLFSLADISSVNLESVVGTLAYEDAYKGKRYLLQSPPYTLAALEELGVDLVTLGNNHTNDWLEPGLSSTIRNLDEAGINHTGAGADEEQALKPALLDAGSLSVGMVSLTTVTGDYVNDSLPGATAPEPASLADDDKWQYELREFGFGSPGEPTFVETGMRRPGTMWDLFESVESEVGVRDAADLWQEVSRVYPELQDWVARRGHGGAAHFSRSAVESAVADARSSGADLVVVQLHGGFQFAEVSSDYFGEAARSAVDAGADLVIGHHPHVLQGFEVYEGTLIAYSLGNFVFDQDFLATHQSVVLRTVFEGTELMSATVYPTIIDGYRPVAASGAVADRIVAQINEASLQNAESIRLPDRRIGSTPTSAPATAMAVRSEGRIEVVPADEPTTRTVELDAATPTALGAQLIRNDDNAAGLLIGRDVFGYGSLEDYQADGSAVAGLEWSVPPNSLQIDPASPHGQWVIRLDRTSQHLSETLARTAARVSMPDHRWFGSDGVPIDGEATHSVRVSGKRVGAGIPFVRVIYYDFDDTDPAGDPKSQVVASVDIDLPLVNDGTWHELWVDLPAKPPGANTALVGVGLAPPQSQSGTVWIDGLEVIEWRAADQTPAGVWTSASYVWGDRAERRALTVVDH